jgi:uncharacterized protein (DUF58 family)
MPFRDAWIPVGALLVFIGLVAGKPLIVAVGLVIVVLGAVARFWSRELFERVTVTARLGERRAFAGEEVSLGLALENRKMLPLPWYELRVGISESLPVETEQVSGAAFPGLNFIVRRGALGWYQRHEWEVRVSPNERGFHQVGPATLRSADLLGAFPRVLDDDKLEHLVVFPRVYPLSELGMPAERPFGDRRGRNRIFEDPLRISGLREYRVGDTLRRIDWKATARTGELQSRVYEPSATLQLYLMVNIDTMLHAWEGYLHDDLERTLSAAASIAVWAAGARYSIGLLANGAFPNADRPIRLAPSRSRDQITRVLEALAVVQPLSMGDLASAMERERGRLPAGSTIVVVASLVPPELSATMTRFAEEGHQVFLVGTAAQVAASVPPGIPFHDVSHELLRMEAAE